MAIVQFASGEKFLGKIHHSSEWNWVYEVLPPLLPVNRTVKVPGKKCSYTPFRKGLDSDQIHEKTLTLVKSSRRCFYSGMECIFLFRGAGNVSRICSIPHRCDVQ